MEFFIYKLGYGLGLEIYKYLYLNKVNREKLRIREVVINKPIRILYLIY
jgi:hypothetical protein